jgi:hypothetical protein
MEKGKRILIRLLIVLISVYFIDGGRSFLLVSDNIRILLVRNHVSDLEAPHQHYVISFNTEEKWVNVLKYDFSFFAHNPVKLMLSQDSPSQEFTDSIWQPPKLL